MLHATRLSCLIAAVVLGIGFPSALAHAQTLPGDEVDEEWNLKMPFIVRNVSPEIVSVSADCKVYQGSSTSNSDMRSSKYVTVLVSDLGKQQYGRIAGTLETRHLFKRPAAWTGFPGTYVCFLWGRTAGGAQAKFSSDAGTPSRFKVTGNTTIKEYFKW